MLVLSRQRNESIMIGDDIEVTVVDIRGDKVRLGINAPNSTSVHRKEIWLTIKKQDQTTEESQARCLVCGKPLLGHPPADNSRPYGHAFQGPDKEISTKT